MNETGKPKKNKVKMPVRRINSKSFQQHKIFDAFCVALACENWTGALMLYDLHDHKGEMSDIEYELRNLADGRKADGQPKDNPPHVDEKEK